MQRNNGEAEGNSDAGSAVQLSVDELPVDPPPAGTRIPLPGTPGAAAKPYPSGRTPRGTFASLQVRDYRWLWFGSVGSSFAMNMQIVARGWLVYAMTDSALALTWVTLSFMLPMVVFSLWGGVLADRLEKKRIIIAAQSLNFLATLVMGTIVITGHVTFWDFIWFGAFNGAVLALGMPARSAMVPELVGERLVFNAMSLNTTSWNLSRVLGPALAGFAIGWFSSGDTSDVSGVGKVYWIIAGLYLLSAVTMLGIRGRGAPVVRAGSTALGDIAEGLRYVRDSRLVLGLILMSVLPFLFGMSINTLAPAFVSDVLDGGPDELGLFMTVMGAGAIVGSLLVGRMGEVRHKGWWLFGTSGLWGLLLLGIALTTDIWWSWFWAVAIGVVSAVYMSMNRSLIQVVVAQEMRGRIMSIDMMSHGLMPLGIIPIGWIADVHGVGAGLLLAGGALLAVTLVLLVAIPVVRRIDV